jgi:hypothetical protein
MHALSLVLICAGLGTGVTSLVVLHLLPTGLSPIRNPVSQYGISKYRAGYRNMTIAYGVAGVGAAIGIASLPGSPAVTVLLCAIFAIARAVISWYPMDEPGGERTVTGRRHGLLAIAAFLAIALASRQFAVLLNHDNVQPGLATASNVCGLVMLASLIITVFVRRGGLPGFGAVERVFYLGATAWLVVVAVLMSRLG